MEINKRGVQDLYADILYQDARSDDDEVEDKEEKVDVREEDEEGGRREEEEREAIEANNRRQNTMKSSRFSRNSDSYRYLFTRTEKENSFFTNKNIPV